ncbi:MAG: T9SS type A sorting domain-containing protein [Chloroflexi bacterium]|nr:MAG: T9SS type A sorting domain-containing protein [Chloroflexota bacterium]
MNNADVTAFCVNAQATSHASFTTSIQCGKCWLTGGGQSFDSDGHLHSYGGVVNPGCSPTAAGGGNWNDLDHTTGAHFKGETIVVDVCGNVPGIPPGSSSPKTPFNFIEFHGTGTFISGHGNKRVDVCFNGHYEDRHEPGSLGQTDDAKKDRYFLRVYTDCNNPVGSTVLLVDVDGNPGTQDPATIFHGNLQLHISGCDKAPRPGQLPSLDDPAIDPMIDVSPLPTELSFGLPRPNPTGTGMTLQYSLPKDALVSAKVFDVAGRVVRNLGDGPVGAGVHVLSWDLQDESGQHVSPGLFFVRLSVDGQVQMRHVTVLP